MSNSHHRKAICSTCFNIIMEAPLVLPYAPSTDSKDLWLEVRKRRIEDAFERTKDAQYVLENRVLVSDIPDIFPSFCLCYLGQLPIEDLTSQERRTLLSGAAIECLLRSPAELLLETQAFEAQSRAGLKSRPLADAFAKMPASYDYMRSSAGAASITIAARILLGEVIASFVPQHSCPDGMRQAVNFTISAEQTRNLSQIFAEMAAGQIPIINGNEDPAIRRPLVRAFFFDLRSMAELLRHLLAEDLVTRH